MMWGRKTKFYSVLFVSAIGVSGCNIENHTHRGFAFTTYERICAVCTAKYKARITRPDGEDINLPREANAGYSPRTAAIYAMYRYIDEEILGIESDAEEVTVKRDGEFTPLYGGRSDTGSDSTEEVSDNVEEVSDVIEETEVEAAADANSAEEQEQAAIEAAEEAEDNGIDCNLQQNEGRPEC